MRITRKLQHISKYLIARVMDNHASPLVEEGLLIGLAIIIFAILVAMINDILDWVSTYSSMF